MALAHKMFGFCFSFFFFRVFCVFSTVQMLCCCWLFHLAIQLGQEKSFCCILLSHVPSPLPYTSQQNGIVYSCGSGDSYAV